MLYRSGQLRFAAGRRPWDMPILCGGTGTFYTWGKHRDSGKVPIILNFKGVFYIILENDTPQTLKNY